MLTDAWELKWHNFWDALTRQRTDGALVRLITPVYPNEALDDADRRLWTEGDAPAIMQFGVYGQDHDGGGRRSRGGSCRC